MARHVKAFTYKPKINAVRSGECTQTVRPVGKKEIKELDTITYHGWGDRPYWSKWSWRLKVETTNIEYIGLCKSGIVIIPNPFIPRIAPVLYIFCPWDTEKCNIIAKKDFIDPPTGKDMGELFNDMYELPDKTKGVINFQIITWEV